MALFLGFCYPVPDMGEFLPLVHLQARQGHAVPGHQQCSGGGNGRHGPRHRRPLLDLPVPHCLNTEIYYTICILFKLLFFFKFTKLPVANFYSSLKFDLC